LAQPVRISLLLRTASDIKNTHTRDDQIRYLRTVYNEPLRYIIQGALHPGVEWLLPKGQIFFSPMVKDADVDSKLYREYKKLYIFCKGGNDDLDQKRRENLFVQLLESIHPEDAELLIAVKDKYLPYPGLDYKLFQDAYPGILPDPVVASNNVVENIETPNKTTELTNEELLALYSARFKTSLAPQPVSEVKKPSPNKGKMAWNNGVKNFLASKEEAELKGYSYGRLKK
jgi:hypothetical protein